MLFTNIKNVLRLRGITQTYAWLIKAGFPISTAQNLNRDNFGNLPLAHIEKLCLLLRCTPNDLLRWEPETGMDSKNQPLSALLETHNSKGLEWLMDVGSKSMEELREMGKKLQAAEGNPDPAGDPS